MVKIKQNVTNFKESMHKIAREEKVFDFEKAMIILRPVYTVQQWLRLRHYDGVLML